MDRREALKKLAVGGAAAAGVTAVMTSTAFANPGTQDCKPTQGSYSTTGTTTSSTATISVTTTVAAACPGTPCGGADTTLVSYTWTGGVVQTGGTSIVVTPGQGNTVPWSLTVTVRCRDRNGQLTCSRKLFNGTVARSGSVVTVTGLETNQPVAYDPGFVCS